MPGRIFTQLLEVAQNQHGFLRPDDLRELGIDPKRLVDLQQRGQAERRVPGLYRLVDVPHDDLEEYLEAAWWPSGHGVLSHATALDLYELCDVNPNHIDITLPVPHRVTRAVPARYRVHRRKLDKGDITRWRGLPMVTVKRAILDGIDTHMRGDLVDQAIKTARDSAQITRKDLEEIQDALLKQRRAARASA